MGTFNVKYTRKNTWPTMKSKMHFIEAYWMQLARGICLHNFFQIDSFVVVCFEREDFISAKGLEIINGITFNNKDSIVMRSGKKRDISPVSYRTVTTNVNRIINGCYKSRSMHAKRFPINFYFLCILSTFIDCKSSKILNKQTRIHHTHLGTCYRYSVNVELIM